MGKLGDCIRGTDFVGTKRTSEYSRSSDEPRHHLRTVEDEYENGGLTLEDLQDAYWAFGEKVGIPDYPGMRTPASDLAKETIKILVRLTSEFLKKNENLQSKIAEIVFHTMISFFKAGLGPTHCEMIEELNKYKKILKVYVETFDRQQLVAVLALTKVEFRIISNDALDTKRGDMQRESIKIILLLISTKQLAEVQKEFLEVYRHYMVQLPVISGNENYCLKMNYLTDEILANFEQENPYLHLKDPNIVKDHVNLAKDIIFHENYVHDGPIYSATKKMLQKILEAIRDDGIVTNVFDHLIDVLLEIITKHRSLKQAKEIFYLYSYYLFELAVAKTPVQEIYKSSINMCLMLLTKSEALMQPKTHEIVCRAIENVIMKVKKLPDEDVQNCLKIMIQMLQSGRKKLVDVAQRFLQSLKKSKSLDWKKHLEEAKQMITIVGEIPGKKMQADKDTRISDTVSEYADFIKELLEQLQQKKLQRELTEAIFDCLFNSLAKDPPLKKRIAEEGTCSVSLEFKDKRLRVKVLKKFEDLVKQDDFPWEGWMMSRPMRRMLDYVIKSFQSGEDVTPEENTIFMSIFKAVSDDGDSVDDQFYDEHDGTNWRMEIFHDVLQNYVQLHSSPKSVANLLPIMPNVFRWARLAVEDEHERMTSVTFGYISCIGQAACPELKHILPEIVDLLLETKNTRDLFACVSALYPYNPEAIHSRLEEFFDSLEDDSDEDAQRHFAWILNTVASQHPEIFKKDHIEKLFVRYQEGYDQEKILVLMIFKAISEKHPSRFKEFFAKLCDDTLFKTDTTTMAMRCGLITCVGGVDKVLGERAVDYLMKYVASTDQTTALTTAGSLRSMVKKHQNYMQKYKTKLENAEKKATSPQLKDIIHDIVLVLEGKSVEHIAEDVQQQQEDMAVLDEKVDATIDTVVKVGEKVVEHDKEIGELAGDLERVEERVDDVEEDLGETKIKVEEIDNKTMTNAPKWSRDLTKLMNPVAENDWRLLGSRLGYSNDDIRGWATQHDPCMALLSEWYATHKTSEASYAVLTALTEMNRMDGAVIVENAMKAAEGVVEDEEFEYPSPPPVFISYQWGFQNEVKLLKQHLNMAGYECWMDVGQMGGGDKLFAKIDNGIRGAKVVICCTTEKYAQSPNCNREVNLSVNLNKPIIPLLMEQMDWPPKGSMGPIFSEYLFIRFFQRDGEETGTKDKRYWPIPKFQELLMQLNFFVVPDQKLVKKEYANWWTPITEDITVDKNKGKKQTPSQKPKTDQSQVVKAEKSPLVFLSYQWGKQPQVKALYQRLTSLGYTVWMDIYQMGGGDSLYDKIDRGIRGCRVVVSCVTQKYSLSANCRREVSLADALKKPMIPLLLEQLKWPPDGPMSMVFTELLFINFYRDEAIQMIWKGEKFDELLGKLSEVVPNINGNSEKKDQSTGKSVKNSGDGNNKAEKEDTVRNNKDVSFNTSNDAKTKGRTGTSSNKTSSAVKRTDTSNRGQGTDGKEIRGKNQGNDLRSTETNKEKDNSAMKAASRKEPNDNKKESIMSNSSLETPHSRAVQASAKGSPNTSNRVQGTDGKEIRGKNQGNDLRSTETNTERADSAIKPASRKQPNNNKKESITSNSSLETPNSRAVQASTKGSPVGSKPIPRNRATSAKTSSSDLKTTDVHAKSMPGNNDTTANQLRKNDAKHNNTATLEQKTIESASASHSEQSGERIASNIQAEKTADNHTDNYSGKHNDTDAVQLNKNTVEHNNTSSLQSDTIAHIPTSQSKQERFIIGQGKGNSKTGNKSNVAKQDDQNVYVRHSERDKTPIKSPATQPQSKSCTIL